MAIWTQAERANIRHYLGFSATWTQADPRTENAMQAVLAIADGGSQPDNSTQTQIQGWLADLVTLETQFKTLWTFTYAGTVDELKVDPYRGMLMLRREGQRIVTNIARALGVRPRADVFSSTPAAPSGTPYPDIESDPFARTGYTKE